jgi:hypothetical protein
MVPGQGGFGAPGRIGKTRHPWGVFGLTLITFGIYFLVWYYKICCELRDYEPQIPASPGVSLAAVLVGSCVVVPYYVSICGTAGRISRAQTASGQPGSCSGAATFFLSLIGFHSWYLQKNLNKVWAAYGNPPEGTFRSH